MPFNTPVILLVIQILIAIVLLGLYIIFFRRIFKKPPANGVSPNFYTRQSRIIALGFTTMIFPGVATAVFIRPFILLTSNITYIINFLSGNIETVGNGPARFDISYIGQSYTDYLSGFPLSRLLFAVALAILIYQLISYCTREIGEPVPNPAAGSNAFLYNLSIVFVLAFSLFLVISVFISIPYLNEIKKPSLFTKGGLDSSLNAIRISDTSLARRDFDVSPFSGASTRDTIISGDTAARNRYNALDARRRKQFDDIFSNIDEQRKDYESSRKETISRINNGIEQYAREKPAIQQKLELNYERNAQSNGVDKDLLFATSVSVYRDYIRVFRDALSQSYILLSQNDTHNAIELDRLIKNYRSLLGTLSLSDSNTTVTGINYYNYRFFDYSAAVVDAALNYDVNVQASKRDGSDWGFFGLIAHYLITTESLDLVLLIGMLGFGLLGASFSSFQSVGGEDAGAPGVPSFMDTFQTKPIIRNFWNVLARGFSAAILVYLATKGGIAIFTANASTDPNGYVLLFTCFVAAVFSEKVWAQVKAKYGL